MKKEAAMVLLLAAACGERGTANAQVQLRSYSVPSRATELRGALASLFGKRDDARAELAPDGTLLVLGPQRVQEGVAEVIGEMAKHPSPPPPLIRMSYWFVLGKRGQEPRLPPELAEVKGTLDEVQRLQGPQQFSLVEKLQLSTASGESGEVKGRDVRAEQQVSAGPGGLRVRLEIGSSGRNSLRTLLQLTAGQVTVLAQSAADRLPNADASSTLYYLVRADLQGTGGQQ